MNYNLYKSFNFSRKNCDNVILNFFYNLSRKQKISMFVPIICFFGLFISYASSNATGTTEQTAFKTVITLLGDKSALAVSFATWTGILEITKYAINYIVEAQLTSIDIIAETPLGGEGAFDKLTTGLTLFAAIACFYKLLLQFRDTERFDNVKAFTGFFSYIGILILFIFSTHIVDYVVSFNSNINTNNITKIGSTIDNELNEMIVNDFIKLKQQQKVIQDKIDSEDTGVVDAALLELKKSYEETSFCLSNMIKYIYYSFFGLLMTAVLAVPTVIMTLMVKIILSIMILGAKLVFLLAFIPGFENTWKTYMLNLLNVILWVPIFNIIISFIIALMTAFLFTHPSGTGQIIWLSIVSLILAVQSISLTTTAASTIISGAGAGVGGALGGLNSMSGPAVIGGAAVAVAGGAMAAATISKFSKD